jgi:hypothetical protein
MPSNNPNLQLGDNPVQVSKQSGPKTLRRLYNNTSKSFDLGSFEDFTQRLKNPTDRAKFYNNVSQEFELGSFNEFTAKIDSGYVELVEEQKTEEDGIIKALTSGLENSVTGLLVTQGAALEDQWAPDSMAERVAFQIGTTVGDLPTLLAGGVLGAGSGAAIGGGSGAVVGAGVGAVPGSVIGGVVGAGAGSMALTEGTRTVLMDFYEQQQGGDFRSFWDKLTRGITSAGKGAVLDTVIDVLTLDLATDGTAEAGLGVGMNFTLEDDSGNKEITARS